MNRFLDVIFNLDLNDLQTRILFIILVSIIFILIIAIFVLYFTSKSIQSKINKKKSMTLLANNQRIFSYDYSRGLFFYFDRLNPKNERILTNDEFLSFYISNDKFRIENWLKDIRNGNSYSQFIQVDRHFEGYSNLPLTCILILTKIDKEKHIIHFEMHILPYIDTSSHFRKKERYVLKDEKQENDFIHDYEESTQGAIYYLRLYTNKENDELDSIKVKTLKNKIYNDVILKYLSATRRLIQINDSDMLIVDTSTNSKLLALNYASTIQSFAQDIIKNQGEQNNFEFLIGISIQQVESKTFINCKEEAKLMIDAIIKKESFNKVLIYDPNFTKNITKDAKNKKDTILYVKNSTFDIFFLSSVDVLEKRLGPLFLKIVNYGIDIDDFKEVVTIASNIDDGNKCIQLFKNLDFKLIKQLKIYKEELNIVLQIPYESVELFYRAIDPNIERNFNYTLLIEEKELSSRISIQDEILKQIKRFKKDKSINFAMLISTSSTAVVRTILEEMKYYVIPSFMTKSIQLAQTRANLYKISTFYKTLSSPLCFINLKDTIDIDLALLYSGRIVQCDAFSKPSSRISPISTKLINQIVKDENKLIDDDFMIE